MTATSTDGEPIPLIAELWFEDAPDLIDPKLLAALRALSPDTEAQQDSITVPYAPGERNGNVGGSAPLVTELSSTPSTRFSSSTWCPCRSASGEPPAFHTTTL